jgi:hypothetical protein
MSLTTAGRWSFGDDEAQLGDYARFAGNSGGRTQPVATRKPNAFGLYDMHGNVFQWVEDPYHNRYDGVPSDGVRGVKLGTPATVWIAAVPGTRIHPIFARPVVAGTQPSIGATTWASVSRRCLPPNLRRQPRKHDDLHSLLSLRALAVEIG